MKSIRYISFWGLTRDHHCWHLPLITIANIYHLPHCQIHLQEMLRMWSLWMWGLTRDHHCWHLPLITIANIYHLPHCQIHLQEMLRMWSPFIWTLPMSCLILQMTLISLYIRRSSLKLFINRWSCCTWEMVFSIRHIYLARSRATFS